MGSFSLVHWIIIIGVIVLLFGTGKISGLMGDVAKGIKAFKKGLADDEPAKSDPKQLQQPASPVSEPKKDETRAS